VQLAPSKIVQLAALADGAARLHLPASLPTLPKLTTLTRTGKAEPKTVHSQKMLPLVKTKVRQSKIARAKDGAKDRAKDRAKDVSY
jgi:hypothetical protein